MNRTEWRNQVVEAALDPELPIIDAHHHIWTASPAEPWEPYGPDELIADKTNSGHNVIGTVYVDSHANYADSGPAHLRVVGETEFAGSLGDECEQRGGGAAGVCAGVVTHADLMLGAAVGEVLDAHLATSARFRGIRHMTAIDEDLPPVYGATEFGIMKQPKFREGFAELVRRGLSFDAWLFHPQLQELVELARSFPDANIVLDHTGGPIGVGRFAKDRKIAFVGWKRDMAELAKCHNVSVKLGGLNMSYSGMDATEEAKPHSSQRTADLQRNHILTAIDLFGPDRCMFESNFPVDMRSISYDLVWNSFKRIVEDFSPEDRKALFGGTAKRVYRLSIPL